MISQGTVSIICGCHSPVHSILVIKAWIKLYRKFPNWKEAVCIFLHDIGHAGLNYLDDYEQKKLHWDLGAYIAHGLFGKWAWDLTAGHCSYSGLPKSKLYYADKLSWHVAPRWWLWLNTIFEPKLAVNCHTRMEAVNDFKQQVALSIGNGRFCSTHDMYLERLNGNEL